MYGAAAAATVSGLIAESRRYPTRRTTNSVLVENGTVRDR
jgi:hypothetical protein